MSYSKHTNKPNKRVWRPKSPSSLLETSYCDIKHALFSKLTRADYFVLSCCSKSMRDSVVSYHKMEKRPRTKLSLSLEVSLSGVKHTNLRLYSWALGITGGHIVAAEDISTCIWQAIADGNLASFTMLERYLGAVTIAYATQPTEGVWSMFSFEYTPDTLAILRAIRGMGYAFGPNLLAVYAGCGEIAKLLIEDLDNCALAGRVRHQCIYATRYFSDLQATQKERQEVIDYLHLSAIHTDNMELVLFLDNNGHSVQNLDLLYQMMEGCKLQLLEHYLCTGNTRFLWTQEIEDFALSLGDKTLTSWIASNIYRFAFADGYELFD